MEKKYSKEEIDAFRNEVNKRLRAHKFVEGPYTEKDLEEINRWCRDDFLAECMAIGDSPAGVAKLIICYW